MWEGPPAAAGGPSGVGVGCGTSGTGRDRRGPRWPGAGAASPWGPGRCPATRRRWRR
ncbi:hypothetical protein SSAG_03317 [Streptomyces sp. Mg1]|nr:hypothetical protein SSAG_03317 [Streptomyces sp. Mg1]